MQVSHMQQEVEREVVRGKRSLIKIHIHIFKTHLQYDDYFPCYTFIHIRALY